MHVWWKQVYLSYVHSIGQANQNSVASMQSMLLPARRVWGHVLQVKLYALTRIESEGILNIFCIGVFLTLAVHIAISYSYIYISVHL